VPEEGRQARLAINGEKMWTTGMHVATHVMVFAAPAARTATPWASPASDHPGATPA
jgi:alkylation response protein AidB-like acyl-CoA dehydrogenase